MSGVRAGRVVKLKNGRREKARPVLRMMAIMQEGNNEELPKAFVEGGRTGRRNAMPDILHPPDVHATTADLPSRLQQLATDEGDAPRMCTESDDDDVNITTTNNTNTADNAQAVKPKRKVTRNVFLAKTLPFKKEPAKSEAVINTCSCSHASGLVEQEITDHECQFSHHDVITKESETAQCSERHNSNVDPNEYYSPCRNASTTVSETSWKYCCSSDRLQGFLNLCCAKRRNAVSIVAKNKGTNVSTTEVRRQDPIPRSFYDFKNPDIMFAVVSKDPNNPQPGPSTSADTSTETAKTEDAEKKDSAS